MNLLETIDKNRMVTFKNELLSSPFRKQPELTLSTAQTKLILFLVSLIDMDDKEFNEVKISYRQFCEHFGFSYDGGKSKKLIRHQLVSLSGKNVYLKNEDGTVETLYHWLAPIHIYPKEYKIGFKLADELRPYYLELKNNFTQYQLGYVTEFRNKYSFLLYDTLKRWSTYNKGEFFYPIETAKADLSMGKYEDMRDFTRHVLKPAVEEINNKSDLHVVYRFAKAGRKITTICFTIRTKSEKALNEIKATWDTEKEAYSEEKEAFAENLAQLVLDGFDDYEEVEI